jgi:hypothetical protein
MKTQEFIDHFTISANFIRDNLTLAFKDIYNHDSYECGCCKESCDAKELISYPGYRILFCTRCRHITLVTINNLGEKDKVEVFRGKDK